MVCGGGQPHAVPGAHSCNNLRNLGTGYMSTAVSPLALRRALLHSTARLSMTCFRLPWLAACLHHNPLVHPPPWPRNLPATFSPGAVPVDQGEVLPLQPVDRPVHVGCVGEDAVQCVLLTVSANPLPSPHPSRRCIAMYHARVCNLTMLLLVTCASCCADSVVAAALGSSAYYMLSLCKDSEVCHAVLPAALQA
jgi:hypothetical protein